MRKLFISGDKIQLAIFTIVVIMLSVLSFNTYELLTVREFAPIKNVVPQIITNGGYTHTLRVLDTLDTVAIKCNTSNTDIVIEGSYNWVRQDDGRAIVVAGSSSVARSPGCHTYEFKNEIPDSLVVGVWRLEGVDITRKGDKVQTVPWYTQDFTIVQ